jgi:hypothetical protein
VTFLPAQIPLWCWALQGESAVFFSQPTHALECTPVPAGPDGAWEPPTLETRRFPPTVCVARCQDESRFVMDEPAWRQGDLARGLTPPIQCGHIGRLDAEGRFLCDMHYAKTWLCTQCGAYVPAPADAPMSPEGWIYC